MPTRSITDPKASQRLEEFAERLPEALAEGNARRKDASPASLLDEQRLQSTELVQDAGIARRERLEEVGTLGGWKRAFDTTTTGHLVDSGLAKLMLDEEADPSWRMTVPDYNELLNAHGLQGSEHVFDRLNTATSADQANRMATSLKKQQVALEELDGHGVKVFLASAMDPVENATMVAAAAATKGVAIPLALGARASRVAYATSQVGALVGTMQAGRAAGAEYSAEDLLLTGAIGGLLSYKFAPALTGKPKAESGAPQQGSPEVPPARTEQEPLPATAQPTSVEVPVLRDTVPSKLTPANVGEAVLTGARKPDLGKAKGTDFISWEAKAQSPKVRKFMQSAGAIGRTGAELFASLVQKAAGSTHAEKLADASAALREAGILGVKSGGTKGRDYTYLYADDAPAAAKKTGVGEPPKAGTEVPTEVPVTPQERVVQDIIDVGTEVSPKAARGTTGALTDGTTSVAEQTARGTADTPVGRAPGAVVPQAEMPDGTLVPADAVARTQEVASQQRGFAGVGKEKAAKAHRFFTELVSEYEKLTAGIPAVRAFLSNLLDDPLRRTGLIGDNASSRFRENTLKANYEMQQYETAVSAYLRETTGVGPLRSLFGFSQKYTDSRLALEDELYGIMLQRHQAYTTGKTVPKANIPKLQELVEVLEEVTHGSAQRSKEDGLHGMQGYERSPGYVHRAWNYEKMVRYQNAYGTPFVIQMLEASARKGLPEASAIEVKAIAKAIYDRTMDKAQGARSDYMGQLGKTESDGILELLKLGGTDDTIIESVRRRLETLGQDKTGVKYVRDRLPLDMTLRFNAPDGSIIRMQDLVDTDISRLLENYQQSMAGRGALAHVGIGGDEAGLATYMNKYRKLLDTQDLTPAQKEAMQQQLEHIVGDFTGIRPVSAVLSPTMSFLKSTATAAMLGSTGVLQVAESSVVAARNGALSTFKHMLSAVPGLRTLMQEVGSSAKLHESFTYATKVDFSTDTRIRSWKGQHEVGLVQDSSWQRLAYAQQQLVPTLTAQRWVHKQQSNMLLNQNLHTLWRASKGDADAIQQVKGFGYLTDAHLERIKQIEELTPKGKLADLRLGILSDGDLAAVTDTITRMQDHTLFATRPGYGTSYQRSAVGQLLGQFTSYVGLSHNLLLRQTYEHEGALGVAKILAYQYPVMLMVTYMNELRKGNVLDLDNDDDLKKLAMQALSYSSVIGLYGDVVSTVFGSQSRSGVAALGVMDAGQTAWRAFGDLAEGEFEAGAAGSLQALRQASILGAVPGSQALVKALQEDK